jgi:hypothetical protein
LSKKHKKDNFILINKTLSVMEVEELEIPMGTGVLGILKQSNNKFGAKIFRI